MGAIGIARSFVWIGENQGKIFYKPNTFSEYLNENMNNNSKGIIQDTKKHSVQIEYETKLKHIPEIMHTEYAEEIDRNRVDYFKKYLDVLENEIYCNIL